MTRSITERPQSTIVDLGWVSGEMPTVLQLIGGFGRPSRHLSRCLARGERSGSVIRDAEAFMRGYAPKVAGTLVPYGGRFLTSAKVTALEGDVPQRFVIIAFDNAEKARAWYDSSAYQQLVPIRQKTATSTLFIAEGRPK